MNEVRKFRIIVDSKELCTCSGSSPGSVAKKVVKKLCEGSKKIVKFSLKECKRDCKKVYGPYQGHMEKLDKPYKRNGKTITHRAVCEKIQIKKMKGGKDLGVNDFKVLGDKPFRSEIKKKFFKKEQLLFFDVIANVSDRKFYQYVGIKDTSKKVTFKRHEITFDGKHLIEAIEITNIDSNILIELYINIVESINKGEQPTDFATTIRKTLEEHFIKNLNYNQLEVLYENITVFCKSDNPICSKFLKKILKKKQELDALMKDIIDTFKQFKNNNFQNIDIRIVDGNICIFFNSIKSQKNIIYNFRISQKVNQYVVFEDTSKNVTFKRLEENSRIEYVKITDIEISILRNLYIDILESINEGKQLPYFAIEIRKTLEEHFIKNLNRNEYHKLLPKLNKDINCSNNLICNSFFIKIQEKIKYDFSLIVKINKIFIKFNNTIDRNIYIEIDNNEIFIFFWSCFEYFYQYLLIIHSDNTITLRKIIITDKIKETIYIEISDNMYILKQLYIEMIVDKDKFFKILQVLHKYTNNFIDLILEDFIPKEREEREEREEHIPSIKIHGKYIIFYLAKGSIYQYAVFLDSNGNLSFKTIQNSCDRYLIFPITILELISLSSLSILENLYVNINEYIISTIDNNNININKIFRKLEQYLSGTEELDKNFLIGISSSNISPIRIVTSKDSLYVYFDINNIPENNNYTFFYFNYLVIIKGNEIIFKKVDKINHITHITTISIVDINDIPMHILYDLQNIIDEKNKTSIDLFNLLLIKLHTHLLQYSDYKMWVESILKGDILKMNNGNKKIIATSTKNGKKMKTIENDGEDVARGEEEVLLAGVLHLGAAVLLIMRQFFHLILIKKIVAFQKKRKMNG